MRRLSLLLLVPLAFAVPSAPASATPICQYVGTTGTLLGEQVLANPCIGYAGAVQCVILEPGTAVLGLDVVLCAPAVL